jgi:hypothetical protein
MAPPKKTRTSRQPKTVVTFAILAIAIAAVGVQCGRVAWSTGSIFAGVAAAGLIGIAAFWPSEPGSGLGPARSAGS